MPEITPSILAELGLWFVVFLLSTTLHEAAHALLALLGGDDTAYQGGQVSLSPLPHMSREPFGMVLVPIASFLFNGWMMGWASTPYDPAWADRHPRRQALMSAAGPAANLLLTLVCLGILALLVSHGTMVAPEQPGFRKLAEAAPEIPPDSLWHPVAAGLSIALSLNLLLFILNLIPLPPMDGSGILHGLFPHSLGRLFDMARGNPMVGLVGLLIAWHLLPRLFQPAFGLVIDLLYPGVYVH